MVGKELGQVAEATKTQTPAERAKEDYLERKRQSADRRKQEKRRAEVSREIARLEAEIIEIDELLFGEAATDYVRAAELTDRKITAEDMLMSLYEEEESFSEVVFE